jgi:hypothetical protein
VQSHDAASRLLSSRLLSSPPLSTAADRARSQHAIDQETDLHETQFPLSASIVEPAMVPEILRRVAAKSNGNPLTLRIACMSLSESVEFGGTEFVEFVQQGIVNRDHSLLMLHHQGAVVQQAHRQRLARFTAGGGEVRLVARRLTNMIILGSEFAIVPATGRPGRPVAMVVRKSEFVRILHRLHSALWEHAVEFSSLSRALANLVPDGVYSQVLAKLCSGVKDETAARQMNVSVRTYRRYVAGILKDLNVTSRFEAGLKVAEFRLAALGLLVTPR